MGGAWRGQRCGRAARASVGADVVEQVGGNDFVSVSVDHMRGVARVTRSALRPPTIEAILEAFDEAARALDRLDRARFRVLIDLRAAPGRNDPEFERAMASRRSDLLRGFIAAAVLVQTPVGELQISRITREDRSDARVFSDEAKALAWLAATRA